MHFLQSQPLRIIHVANFGFKASKVYLHSTAAKLSNGWTRAGHHVINFSDRDITRWTSLLGYKPRGRRETNKLLLKLCRNIKPDVIAFGHADIISAETIISIKNALPNVRLLQWNVDWYVPVSHALSDDPTAENNRQKIFSKRDHLDATFITTAGQALHEISSVGHVGAFLPNPTDASLERGRNFEKTDLLHDLFFASNSSDDRRFHGGEWRSMNDFCRDIKQADPTLECGFYGINGSDKVFGPAYESAITKSRIGLNISRRNDAYLYSSDRLAHMVGNGLAICIDRATGYGDIFSDDEMVFYDTENDLLEKIISLKNDDFKRQDIARKGWEKYTRLFNSTVVAQYMLDVVMGEHNPDKYEWPTTN